MYTSTNMNKTHQSFNIFQTAADHLLFLALFSTFSFFLSSSTPSNTPSLSLFSFKASTHHINHNTRTTTCPGYISLFFSTIHYTQLNFFLHVFRLVPLLQSPSSFSSLFVGLLLLCLGYRIIPSS